MSIVHHPDEMLLSGYTTGQLDLGRHVAVATHLMACRQCQQDVAMFTAVGGVLLDDLPAAEMSGGAFASLSAQLDAPSPAHVRPAPSLSESGLPDFVRRYPTRSWRMVAPGLRMRPIVLPEPGPTRAFLLQSAAGAKLREHTHAGVEITCVLHGGFTHEGGHFGPGDFDLGDDTMDHRPVIDQGEDCLCLVVMEGNLRLKGFLGALLTPLIRL
jgi:putative transcriptional regulator